MTTIAGPAPSGALILVVDDSVASRYATTRQLRAAGFRTEEAATGADALRRAGAEFDAIVLDIQLPDIDGFECCRILRERPDTALLPVVHLSAAYIAVQDRVRGLRAGADAYLTRPVEPAILVATLQTLLRARAAEATQRRTAAQLQAIQNEAPCGIGVVDAGGRLHQANPALLRLLSQTTAALAGAVLTDFVPEPQRDAARDALAAATPSGQGEFELHRPDGSVRRVAWTTSPLADSGERVIVLNDVTENYRIEAARADLLEREHAARAEAERISRYRDDLLAVLSHELRTPLNAMLGWAHVLERHAQTEDTRKGLAAITRNGRLQAQLISDILDLSRLSLGKLWLDLDTCDVNEVVANAVDSLRHSSDAARITLDCDAAATRPLIRADASRLQQIVWNLVSNAVKFSPAGATVRVRVEDAPAGVRLVVADEGEGIAAEYLPRLFERFSQAAGGSRRQQAGLGLGLSIVHHLVTLHGGEISAHSAGRNRGATFTVTLPTCPPLLAAAVVEGQADAATPPSATLVAPALSLLPGLRVLLVDDDADGAAMLAILLRDRGADVLVAGGVDEALARLAAFQPNIVISDIGMPGRDGLDLIRHLRALPEPLGRTRAIALTSYGRERDVEAVLAAGFDAHCAKPFDTTQVIRRVTDLLAT